MEAKGLKHTLAAPGRVVKGRPVLRPQVPSPRPGEAGEQGDQTLAHSARRSARRAAHGPGTARSPGTQPRRGRWLPVAFRLFPIHAYNKCKNLLRGSPCCPKARQRTAPAKRAAGVSGPAGRPLGWHAAQPRRGCGRDPTRVKRRPP